MLLAAGNLFEFYISKDSSNSRAEKKCRFVEFLQSLFNYLNTYTNPIGKLGDIPAHFACQPRADLACPQLFVVQIVKKNNTKKIRSTYLSLELK